MQSTGSLSKYIAVSVLVHLSFIGATRFLVPQTQKLVPVEISFGTGNSRGGSSPKKIAAAPPAESQESKPLQKPKPKIPKSQAIVKTDAPKISQDAAINEKVSPSPSSTQASGSGRATTSGSGSGTTSGSGAGFDDPRIKYRGMVHQLVDSNKKYPRKAKMLQQEGVVVAKIKLSRDGKLLNAEIVDGSPYKILADATLEAIKGIKRFPKIPSELNLEELTFNIPFKYEIKDGDFI